MPTRDVTERLRAGELLIPSVGDLGDLSRFSLQLTLFDLSEIDGNAD